MKLDDVKKIAREKGILTARKRKQDLIREVQAREGNEQCFCTWKECNDVGCLWYLDCKRV